jgi:hypothetical protein
VIGLGSEASTFGFSLRTGLRLGDALLMLSPNGICLLIVGLIPGDVSRLDPVSPSEILLSWDPDLENFG